jgi:ATP-dependent Clp protease protease subunit
MRLVKGTQRRNDEDESEAVSQPPPPTEIFDENGPIWVNKFSEDAARAFVKQLHYQSRRDATAPILIYIDSNGGDAYALLTMIAAIEQVPNEIITVAMSKAMSAGAMLLACGDVRFASEHATIMLHEISAGAVGHIDDINVQHASIVKLNEKLMKLIVKKIKFKDGAAAFKKLLSGPRDLYLDADEAKKLGFIDHIGIPMLYKNVAVQHILSSNPRKKPVESDAKKTKKSKATP